MSSPSRIHAARAMVFVFLMAASVLGTLTPEATAFHGGGALTVHAVAPCRGEPATICAQKDVRVQRTIRVFNGENDKDIDRVQFIFHLNLPSSGSCPTDPAKKCADAQQAVFDPLRSSAAGWVATTTQATNAGAASGYNSLMFTAVAPHSLHSLFSLDSFVPAGQLMQTPLKQNVNFAERSQDFTISFTIVKGNPVNVLGMEVRGYIKGTPATYDVSDTPCGAGFAAPIAICVVTDGTAPTAASGATVDRDHNGHLDQMIVQFSEELDRSTFHATDFVFKSKNNVLPYKTLDGYWSGASEFTFFVKEQPYFDTGDSPGVSYPAPGVTATITDMAGNLLKVATGKPSLADAVRPVMVGAWGAPGDTKVHMFFSEKVLGSSGLIAGAIDPCIDLAMVDGDGIVTNSNNLSTWDVGTSITPSDIRSIWVNSASSRWAGSANGKIYHFQLTPQPAWDTGTVLPGASPALSINGMWGFVTSTTPSVLDVWAAASNGKVYHMRTVSDGSTVGPSPGPATNVIKSDTAVFAASDVGGYISGIGIPAGATITAITSPTEATISTVATATGTNNVAFTVGWDAGVQVAPVGVALNAVHGTSPSDVWAAGADGNMYQYTARSGIPSTGTVAPNLVNTAAAQFLPADIGKRISGTGVAEGTTITGFLSNTQITVSSAVVTNPVAGPFSLRGWEVLVRTVTADTAATTAVTGAPDGTFTSADIGKTVSGPGIAAGTTITAIPVTAPVGKSATLSVATSSTVSGAALTIRPTAVLDSRNFATGATTLGSSTVTSSAAFPPGSFAPSDVGKSISGAGIPAGSSIIAFNTPNSVIIDNRASATAAGVTITVSGVLSMNAVFATSPNDVWAAGSNSRMYHFTHGVTATGNVGASTTVTAATGFLPSDVGKGISGGTIPAGATVASYVSATQITISAAHGGLPNPTPVVIRGWDAGTTPPGAASAFRWSFNAVWAFGANDVFAAGDNGRVYRYTGTWDVGTQVAYNTPNVNSPVTLTSLWGTSATDLWAGAVTGHVFHLTGAGWNPAAGPPLTAIPLNGSPIVYALYGFRLTPADPTEVWAGAERGVVFHYDAAWDLGTPLDALSTINVVWGTAYDDVWAGASNGKIYHFDGINWDQGTRLLGAYQVTSVSGTSPTDVWAGTVNGRIYHFDGVRWDTGSRLTSSVTTPVTSMWGTGNGGITNMWAGASNGIVYHYMSTVFPALPAVWDSGTVLDPLGASRVNSLYGLVYASTTPVATDPIEIWAGASNGQVYHIKTTDTTAVWDGYRAIVSGTTTAANAVITAPVNSFAASDVGLLIAGPGIPTGATIVAFTSSSSVTISAPATGEDGTFAVGISPGTQVSGVAINAVWATSASNVWAGAENGRMYRFSGIIWDAGTQVAPDAIESVWGTASDDVRAASTTRVYHYVDSWNKGFVPVNGGALTSVWTSIIPVSGTSEGGVNVWVADAKGRIYNQLNTACGGMRGLDPSSVKYNAKTGNSVMIQTVRNPDLGAGAPRIKLGLDDTDAVNGDMIGPSRNSPIEDMAGLMIYPRMVHITTPQLIRAEMDVSHNLLTLNFNGPVRAAAQSVRYSTTTVQPFDTPDIDIKAATGTGQGPQGFVSDLTQDYIAADSATIYVTTDFAARPTDVDDTPSAVVLHCNSIQASPADGTSTSMGSFIAMVPCPIAGVEIVDQTAPRIQLARTVDGNRNGWLDGIEFTFTEPVNDQSFNDASASTFLSDCLDQQGNSTNFCNIPGTTAPQLQSLVQLRVPGFPEANALEGYGPYIWDTGSAANDNIGILRAINVSRDPLSGVVVHRTRDFQSNNTFQPTTRMHTGYIPHITTDGGVAGNLFQDRAIPSNGLVPYCEAGSQSCHNTITIKDGAPPVVWNATTVDTPTQDTLGVTQTAPNLALNLHGDGFLDGYRLKFSEAVADASFATKDWSIEGFNSTTLAHGVTGMRTGNLGDTRYTLPGDDEITVLFSPGRTPDTGLKPQITYEKGTMADKFGNVMVGMDIAAVTEIDDAAPVVVKIQGFVGERDVTVTFSEPVFRASTHGDLVRDDFKYSNNDRLTNPNGVAGMSSLDSAPVLHKAGDLSAVIPLGATITESDIKNDRLETLPLAIFEVAPGVFPKKSVPNIPHTLDFAPDITAPGPFVISVFETATRANTVQLTWVAPGSDGQKGGPVASYVVKVSRQAITSANFGDLVNPDGLTVEYIFDPADGPIAVPGQTQSMRVSSLNQSTTYHFAVLAVDLAGNPSPVSNDVVATTLRDATPPVGKLTVKAKVTGNNALFSWNALKDDESKVVYRYKLDDDLTYQVLPDDASTTALSTSLPVTDGTHSFHVAAFSGGGFTPTATVTFLVGPGAMTDDMIRDANDKVVVGGSHVGNSRAAPGASLLFALALLGVAAIARRKTE